MHGPAGWCWYRIVFRTDTHTAVSSAGRRTTARALRYALLMGTMLRRLRARLRARLRGLNALEVRTLRALLLLLMMMMIMVMKIGPILRAGRAHAKGREAYRIQYPWLEETLPRLTRIIAHFRFLAGLLKALLRGVAHVIALMNVRDVARIVSYLENEILGVLLR